MIMGKQSTGKWLGKLEKQIGKKSYLNFMTRNGQDT